MKRREFLSGFAAVGAVPTLPGAVFVSGSGFSEALYARGVHFARTWGVSVPEMYTSALGLDLDQADELFGQLVRNKVIGPPDAIGMARAVSPYFKTGVVARTAVEGARSAVIRDVETDVFSVGKELADQAKHVVLEEVEEGPCVDAEQSDDAVLPEGFFQTE